MLLFMGNESVHQPHDKLFKTAFGDPGNAAAFLRGQMPPGISEAILWDGLRLEPGSFVDSQFRQSESDLLVSTQLQGRQCLIYLLFEHQRVFDPWIALRLLRSMLRGVLRLLSDGRAPPRIRHRAGAAMSASRAPCRPASGVFFRRVLYLV